MYANSSWIFITASLVAGPMRRACQRPPAVLKGFDLANRHMVCQRRRDPAVLARGHAHQLAELAIEVRLVAVAGVECHLYPRRSRPRGHPPQRTLKTQHTAVALGREPDCLAEERNEPAMAVAGLLHHAADVGGGGELLERLGD